MEASLDDSTQPGDSFLQIMVRNSLHQFGRCGKVSCRWEVLLEVMCHNISTDLKCRHRIVHNHMSSATSFREKEKTKYLIPGVLTDSLFEFEEYIDKSVVGIYYAVSMLQ